MSEITPLLGILALGIGAVASGAWLIRSSGANPRLGRRLASAPPFALPELAELAVADRLPRGPVRVNGRVRCADPIRSDDGDRVAARHRDVEVRLPDGRWRVIERLREARLIDLWERTSSVGIDLSLAAEPLVTFPLVWSGSPDELGPAFQGAIERVALDGSRPTAARSTTREVTLVDPLTVLAVPTRAPDGRLRLVPPDGGFLVTAVELETAMRLLAGPHRSRMLTGYAVGLLGLALLGVGAIGLVAALLT